MSGFSNRIEDAPPAVSRQELRASVDRAIAELDRLASLPAGHPDILRMWGAGRRPIVSPWAEYEAFEHELAEHLVELSL